MELRNYRKFRRAAIEFPDGVVGVLGQNGVGKSTLMEAIAWSLYGNESGIVRTGKEGVRAAVAGANEECSVLLEFEIEGDHYRLFRSMKGMNLTVDANLTVNGQLKAKGDRGVTEAVEKLLGMDHKSFFISVFARQKELNALSTLKAAERKKLVLRMLGLDALEEVVRAIDQDANELKKVRDALQNELMLPDGRMRRALLSEEIQTGEADIARIETGLGEIKGQAEELERKVQASRRERERLSERDQEFRKVQGQHIKLSAEKKGAEGNKENSMAQLDALRSKVEELDRLERENVAYEEMSRRKEEMEGRMKLFEERRSLLRQNDSAKDRLAKVKEEVERQNGLEVTCLDAKTRLEEVDGNIETVRQKREEHRQRSRLLEAEIARARKEEKEQNAKREEIVRLGPESKCPTCERELHDQYSVLMAKLERESADRSAAMESHEREKGQEENELARCEQRLVALERRRKEHLAKCEEGLRVGEALSQLRAQQSAIEKDMGAFEDRLNEMGQVHFDEEVHGELRRNLISLKPKVDRYKELKAKMSRMPDLEAEISHLEDISQALGEQLSTLEKEMRDIGHVEGAFKEAQAHLDALISKKEKVLFERSKIESQLSARNAEIASKRERLVELQSMEKRVEESSQHLEEQMILSKAMKDFKMNVIGRVVPTLSELSSHMFAELTDSKYPGLELNDEYEILVLDGGVKYPLSRFSGGESDLANLCLRLAISRLIAERSGSAVNFLILDEIFGSQDQVRKRNILEAFAQLSKRFKQIFLITHIEDVKDFMGNALMVRESEDGTSLVSLIT